MIKMPRTHPKTHFTIEDYAVSMQKLFVKKKNIEQNYTFQQVALLTALGWSTKQICENLQLSPHRVSVIKNSPDLQPFIKQYRAKLEEKAIAESMTYRLQEEFHRSMDTLALLRDNAIEETTQLGASKFMVEKAVDTTIPRKTITEATHKVGVVMLSGNDVKRLAGILDEDADDALEIGSTSQEQEGK